MELSKQYNLISKDFEELQNRLNDTARKAFYSFLDFPFKDNNLVDLGCGDGQDLIYYQKKGAICTGVDSSGEILKLAQNKLTDVVLINSEFESLPFGDETFDIVLSKYAMQTSADVEPILSEANRVLKSGGYFVYLVVHPFRQFIEKKKSEKDYFKKEVVDSVLFDGKLVVKEPTHTMMEYLSKDFLKNFSLEGYFEGQDFPASEKIDNDTYPTFLIIKAKKK